MGMKKRVFAPPPLHGHVVDTDVDGVRLYFCLDASQFLSELPGLPTGHSGGIVSIGTAQENFSVVCFLPPPEEDQFAARSHALGLLPAT